MRIRSLSFLSFLFCFATIKGLVYVCKYMEIIDENRKMKTLNGMAIFDRTDKGAVQLYQWHELATIGEKKRGMDPYELYGNESEVKKKKIRM